MRHGFVAKGAEGRGQAAEVLRLRRVDGRHPPPLNGALNLGRTEDRHGLGRRRCGGHCLWLQGFRDPPLQIGDDRRRLHERIRLVPRPEADSHISALRKVGKRMAGRRWDHHADPEDSRPLIDVPHEAHFVTPVCDYAPNGCLFLWSFLSIQTLGSVWLGN